MRESHDVNLKLNRAALLPLELVPWTQMTVLPQKLSQLQLFCCLMQHHSVKLNHYRELRAEMQCCDMICGLATLTSKSDFTCFEHIYGVESCHVNTPLKCLLRCLIYTC